MIGEVPVGAIDGVNVNYVLAHAPAGGAIALYWNGMRQPPAFYALAGGVNLTLAAALAVGDSLLVDYVY